MVLLVWFRLVRLRNAEEAFHVEAGIIAALTQSQNGEPDNDNEGMSLVQHGALTSQQVLDKADPSVNPTVPCTVLICNISTSLRQKTDRQSQTFYECTREAWELGTGFREMGDLVAVGVDGDVSRGAYKDLCWGVHSTRQITTKKGSRRTLTFHSFNAESVSSEHDLLGRNWSNVTRTSPWYLRGRPIVACFDGKGSFTLIRGAPKGKEPDLYPCI